MTVPGNIDALLLGGQRGYQVERSLRFNSADSAYLNRTPASAGNRKTWTWSGWVKRSKLGVETVLFHAYDGSSSRRAQFLFNTSNQFVMNQGGGGTSAIGNTTAVFRDVSAWYHFVFYADYANTTFKLYVNNVEQTLSYSSSVINADGQINAAIAHQIGSVGGSSAYFDGYLTEVHFIDGQALTPSSFGETDTITGVWKPKRYAGTYGTNGFYLKFADNSGTTSTTLGKDSSGNGNNWTPNNFSVTAGAGNDSMIDTPTPYADGGNGRGNYCTYNPLDTNASPLNGNLDCTHSSFNDAPTTIHITSGKWYIEATCTGTSALCGFTKSSTNGKDHTAVDSFRIIYENVGTVFREGTGIGNTTGLSTYTTNDVIGIAIDISAGTISFYKNNSLINTTTNAVITNNAWKFYTSGNGGGFSLNFGQRPFAYTPPSGFLALNTQNLPEPTIKKPSSYMDVVTYTGTGATRTISGLGFSPDFVWFKNRATAADHYLYDTVRGATKGLYSNLTSQEITETNQMTAFTSDGFTVSTGGATNGNGNGIVAWCWDESATPGFDVVTYTGTGSNLAVNHSLGVTPAMYIIKARGGASNWIIYHKDIGNNILYLNLTNASAANSNFYYSVPNSTQFFNSTSGDVNSNGSNYVAYLWSEVAGFSKFGSYTGNGSSDGPFVFCGFRPRWVILKRTDSLGAWDIHDAARDPDNVVDQLLEAQNSNAEASYSAYSLDFVSNGFKLRGNGASQNAAGGTFIFAAFAESPQKYSLAR